MIRKDSTMSQLDSSNDISLDEDILQTRQDVLRAKDIFPPFNTVEAQEKPKEKIAANSFPVPDFSIKIEPQAEPDEQTAEIPEFDLGMEILANHRKIASAMRKGPAKSIPSEPEKSLQTLPAETPEPIEIQTNTPAIEAEVEIEPMPIPESEPEQTSIRFSHIANLIKPRLSRTEEAIIAEIVRKDIEKFLKSA